MAQIVQTKEPRTARRNAHLGVVFDGGLEGGLVHQVEQLSTGEALRW